MVYNNNDAEKLIKKELVFFLIKDITNIIYKYISIECPYCFGYGVPLYLNDY